MPESYSATRLDRRVTLWRLGSPTRGTMGSKQPVRVALARGLPAQLRPLRNLERAAEAGVAATGVDVFRIRYGLAWADLNAADQLESEGRLYGIQAVDPVGRRRYFDVTAVARKDAPPVA